MCKGRLEAFSDGVLAIIITIMVLELKPPHQPQLDALRPLIPSLLSYLLSFVFVGICWNNHHHLFQAVRRVNGGVLCANLHWLFWLSLAPFVTNWMGETNFSALPVAAYGIVLLLTAVVYTILVHVLVAVHGQQSALAVVLGRDFEGWISLLIYAAAVPTAFIEPRISAGLYGLVAVIWLVPDRRIEKVVEEKPVSGDGIKE